MKRIISAIICLLIMLSLIGCSSSSSSNITTGQSITLSDDTLVCTSKANEDKLISFINANNTSGENGMIQRGEAVILPKGTKVNIIDAGITTEIETQDGQDYFAPMELIK